jgi:hypothetical protein
MARKSCSTGYVAAKIRANTARRNGVGRSSDHPDEARQAIDESFQTLLFHVRDPSLKAKLHEAVYAFDAFEAAYIRKHHDPSYRSGIERQTRHWPWGSTKDLPRKNSHPYGKLSETDLLDIIIGERDGDARMAKTVLKGRGWKGKEIDKAIQWGRGGDRELLLVLRRGGRL